MLLRRARSVVEVPIRHRPSSLRLGHSFLTLLGIAADYYLLTARRPFLVAGLLAARGHRHRRRARRSRRSFASPRRSASRRWCSQRAGLLGGLLSLVGDYVQRVYQLGQGTCRSTMMRDDVGAAAETDDEAAARRRGGAAPVAARALRPLAGTALVVRGSARARDARRGRRLGRRLLRRSLPALDGRDRDADARVLERARGARGARAAPGTRPARVRRDLPEPVRAREDGRDRRPRERRAAGARNRRRPGRRTSTSPTASRSRRSRSGSRCSTNPAPHCARCSTTDDHVRRPSHPAARRDPRAEAAPAERCRCSSAAAASG